MRRWVLGIAVMLVLGWLVALAQLYGDWVFGPLQRIVLPPQVWVAGAGTIVAVVAAVVVLTVRRVTEKNTEISVFLAKRRQKGDIERQTFISGAGSLIWDLLFFLEDANRFGREAGKELSRALLMSRFVWAAAPRVECHLRSPRLFSKGGLWRCVLPITAGQQGLQTAVMQREYEDVDAKASYDASRRIMSNVTLVVHVVGLSFTSGLTSLSASLAWLRWQIQKFSGRTQFLLLVVDPLAHKPAQSKTDGSSKVRIENNTGVKVGDNGHAERMSEQIRDMPNLEEGGICLAKADKRVAVGGVQTLVGERLGGGTEAKPAGELTRVEAVGCILDESSRLGVGLDLLWLNPDASPNAYKKLSDPALSACLNMMALVNARPSGKFELHKAGMHVGQGLFATAGPFTLTPLDFQDHLEALGNGKVPVHWPITDWNRGRRIVGCYLGPGTLYGPVEEGIRKILKPDSFLLSPHINERLQEATYFLAFELYEDEIEKGIPGLTSTTGWKSYVANLQRLATIAETKNTQGGDNVKDDQPGN